MASMFTLLGFKVHVQPGFVMFMALIVVVYGDEFGLWLAGAIAVFTIIHELGHAVSARRNGAHAEISLGFLAGYASYAPTRPISRLGHAVISFSGPGIHIATSVAVLIALGANPLDPSTFDDTAATYAIWWAGPVIGALNLIPILPLDGGHIVQQGVDRLMPGRSDRIMLLFSITVTGIAAVVMFVSPGLRGFGIFIAFLLVTQLQMLGSSKEPQSPWISANNALEAGKKNRARRLLIAALSHSRPDAVPMALALETGQLRALVELLPDPKPFGDPTNEYLLANILISLGDFEDAAHYAAGSFERNPNTLSASAVARASGALGDQGTAIGWLRAAADAGTSPAGLASVIDGSPELIGLRQHPDVQAIRRTLSPV
jgi:Zn-dependent protease